MGALERRTYADDRARGVAHAAVGLALGLAAGHVVEGAAGPAGVAFATGVASAGAMLGSSARAVAEALAADDVERARALLPTLVGRDPTGLDPLEISRAVVESVAENSVDAVVAPAVWAALAGGPGVAAHRALNTLDAMVGHRSDRYLRFGWASARLDDAAGWLPSRVTALAVAAVRPRRARAVWRAVRTQAPLHPSPNGGVAEAAFAAALGVTLGGRNRYGEQVEDRPLLGEGRPAEAADIERAVDLLRDVTATVAAALVLASVLPPALAQVLGRRRGRARATAARIGVDGSLAVVGPVAVGGAVSTARPG
jgi:adenosylcobinamide-phosphate synthase